jgi:DNA-binding transcriptional ArsR family regulator
MVFLMVNYRTERLTRVFAALVDPTRRDILSRLERESSLSITQLAEPLAIKLPAVMKHLDVLGNAGLIKRRKSGRVVTVTLAAAPMAEAMAWLQRYEKYWSLSLDRLSNFLEKKKTTP